MVIGQHNGLNVNWFCKTFAIIIRLSTGWDQCMWDQNHDHGDKTSGRHHHSHIYAQLLFIMPLWSRVSCLTHCTMATGTWHSWARFLSLAWSKLRLCSANHRAGYFSNLACDWLSIVRAYSEQETENGPWSLIYTDHPITINTKVADALAPNRHQVISNHHSL